ncbi:MAG: patatin-like phospholipase family protein [Oligoflexales bacterium]
MGKTALVLSGGGARGAYQAGVIQALSEITLGHTSKPPVDIISGVSAGAINAAYIASTFDKLGSSAERLSHFWSTLTTDQVYKTGFTSLSRIAVNWAVDLAFGAMRGKTKIKALLDTDPLRTLLFSKIDFNNIYTNIANKKFEALEISATNYTTSQNTSFVQAHGNVANWHRIKRKSKISQITVNHVMASASLPLCFPPIFIQGNYYGDGCIRNTAPLSPSIRLGADKLIIIGVRRPLLIQDEDTEELLYPTVARIASVLLNSILLDAIDADLERLNRLNQTITAFPKQPGDQVPLKTIQYLYLHPSMDLGLIAAEKFEDLPVSIKYMLKGLGSKLEASEVISYLLFEPEFCRYLVKLGYSDTMARKLEIKDFFNDHH